MDSSERNLGKLITVYGIASAHLQRVVIVVVLSFLFFLGMMFTYYIRQSAGYFLLASAFLVIYLITLFSWVTQRRSAVEIYEGGMKFKKLTALWAEIAEVSNEGTVGLHGGKPILLPKSLNDLDGLVGHIRQKAVVK